MLSVFLKIFGKLSILLIECLFVVYVVLVCSVVFGLIFGFGFDKVKIIWLECINVGLINFGMFVVVIIML